MTTEQIEGLVAAWTGEALERELDAIFGPDRGRARAERLNRMFGHRAGEQTIFALRRRGAAGKPNRNIKP
jgi:hypothetical protein